uniref:NADH-cytochrome b5 reductase n=1 Tax=Neobodo designis TaxID=312471 RepID=A0A7S1PRL3_NEODS|mmetsp:Transcript_16823/g.52237  ORF Transcript_16823/g.52237 Transcript_16823/m.52237 type:complete len:303 (+) Transcript_16823:170-1078(+)
MVRAVLSAAAVGGMCSFAGFNPFASTATASPQPAVECAAAKPESPFKPNEFTSFRLINSRFESHDTRRFIFALDDPQQEFHLPIASCIVCKFTDADGKDVVRPYTPTSVNGAKGHFELVVKRYAKSKMGTHLFQMRPGETLDMKGPFVKFEYAPGKFDHIGMVAGGTGITPMYQVIRAVLGNEKDKTKIDLVYANNSRKDILMASELCELQKLYPNFHMYLTLTEAPKKWLGGVGLVSPTMLKPFLPKPGAPKSIVLVCGPPPMMKAVSGDKVFEAGKMPQQGPLDGMLKEMGYTADQVFKF